MRGEGEGESAFGSQPLFFGRVWPTRAKNAVPLFLPLAPNFRWTGKGGLACTKHPDETHATTKHKNKGEEEEGGTQAPPAQKHTLPSSPVNHTALFCSWRKTTKPKSHTPVL